MLENVEEEFRSIVKDTLQNYPGFEVTTPGTELKCNICLDNWRKAKLGSCPRATVNICQSIKFNAGRHTASVTHLKCAKAEDSFKIHQEYYEAIFRNAEVFFS